ncbi:MFS transporter [Roseomonas gilardii subsp. gilardii]|uniref:MFS transporter n=1 Tax=Roseomonas gilardii TaxID=257708 RepID=UPI001FFA8B76|nr:MFS transporter [Roseomonas gilardii]UPG72631.1 MFS transporter [Roseomonas gilardii subsp. gilardii]
MSEAPFALARTRDTRPRLATILVFFANGFGYGAWAGNIPSIKLGLGLSDGALGLALLGMAIGAILAMPLTGQVSARWGSHRLTAASGLAFALVLALVPQAGGLATLVLGLMLLGAGNGVMDVSMNTHATLVERGWGAAIMSSFHAAFSLGGLAGAGLAGLLLAAGHAAPLNLAVSGALVALCVLLAMPWLRVEGHAPSVPEEGGHGLALPNRATLGLGVIALLALVTEGAVGDWSALYLAVETAAPAGLAALGFAGFSLAMTAGRLGGDAVVRRLGSAPVLRLGALLSAAGFVLMLAVPSPELAIAGLVLVGLGLSNVFPVLFSAAGRIPGVSPGMGVAMVATMGYGGLLGGPPLLGFLAQVSGLRLALCLLVLTSLAIAWSSRAVRRDGEG